MIWFFLFFSFFMSSFKDFLFLNFLWSIDSISIFICCLCPLILSLIFYVCFYPSSLEDILFNNLFFFMLVFLCFFCFLSSNSFMFLTLLESCVLFMAFLIFFFSKDDDKISSVFFMLFINLLGSLPFMLFSGSLDTNFFCKSYLFFDTFSISLFICFALILVCKLPIFLLHFWLTKAHVSASGFCSMLLASLMLKLGTFGLFKYSHLFSMVSIRLSPILLSTCLFGCIFFCLLMIRFFDCKYLIACSSILHMSMMFPLVAFTSSEGAFSSVLMMVGHGLVSYFLFFLVTFYYETTQNRSFDFNKSLESLNKAYSALIFIFIFLNIGLPPFINFFSELLFCSSLFMISAFSAAIFFFSLLLSIMFSMLLLTKSLFSKKLIFIHTVNNFSLMNYSLFFLMAILFLVFLF